MRSDLLPAPYATQGEILVACSKLLYLYSLWNTVSRIVSAWSHQKSCKRNEYNMIIFQRSYFYFQIELKNITISELPEQTFGSSAAAITMERVDVQALRSRSFSANTYNTVMAINCSFHLIESKAFAQKSLINNLHFYGCKIHQFASNALQSAVASLNISHSR